MSEITFENFSAAQRAKGFDEIVERKWAPKVVVESHTHPFFVEALVVQGEMWLTCGGETRHLLPGDTFTLAHGTPHAERYGDQGATYWVARRCR